MIIIIVINFEADITINDDDTYDHHHHHIITMIYL